MTLVAYTGLTVTPAMSSTPPELSARRYQTLDNTMYYGHFTTIVQSLRMGMA